MTDIIHEIITATSILGHKTYFVDLKPSISSEATTPIIRMSSRLKDAKRFLGTSGDIYPVFTEVLKCYPSARIEDEPWKVTCDHNAAAKPEKGE
jgi:hypothetical protein